MIIHSHNKARIDLALWLIIGRNPLEGRLVAKTRSQSA